jgi:hypothetical protein
MIIDIPHQNELKQLNKGDLNGSIGETFNVDLEHLPSKICLPSKVQINETNDSLASLGLITKFIFYDGVFFAHSAGTSSGTYENVGKIFKGGDSVDAGFTLPTWSGNTTDFSDTATIESFDGQLVLMSEDLWTLGNSSDTSWTVEDTDLTSGLSTKFEGRVYFVNGNDSIFSFADPATVSTSGSYTFDIPLQSEGSISGIDTSASGIWITTSSDGSPETFVYLWDGVSENVFSGSYKVPEPYIMNLKVLNDTPYIVGGSGKIYAFNGSYFEEVARFPFSNILLSGLDDSRSIEIVTSGIGKWIHNNGSTVLGNKLYFLVNPIALADTKTYGDYSKLAGIWCLDPEIGLYHKHAISVLDDNGEMGQLKYVGALTTSGLDTNPSASDAGNFIFGFSYLTENSTSTEKYAIGHIQPIASAGSKQSGYLKTQRIYAQNTADTWEKMCLGFEELESNDSIEVKYRKVEREATNIGVTWSSTTVFTSTDTDLVDIKSKFDTGESYECRVLLGNGSGVISQLTNITEASGTYTVTLDTVHTGVTATNTGQVRLENWKSIETITSAQNDYQFKELPIGGQSNWIQYKIILRGEEIARNKHNPIINRIISVSNQHTPLQ